MNEFEQRQCPECSGEITAIRLIDKSAYGVHTDMEYTVPEARRSFWNRQYPVTGQVVACMCDQCGRILLYGSAADE